MHVLDPAFRTVLEKGDTLFNDPDNHGEPEFRAAMARAGLDAAKLELEHAFYKGGVMANLRLPGDL
jgi:hypothetical protein